MDTRVYPRWERTAVALLTLSSLVTAGVLIRREVRGSAPEQRREPEQISTWRSVFPDARFVTNRPGRDTVLVFVDLECPFCRQVQPMVDSLIATPDGSVAVAIVHNPLTVHRFARRAAQAVECLGRERTFVYALREGYRWQDSLGLSSWWDLARRAGARDSAAFVACLDDPAISAAVGRGLSASQRLGIQETPVVVAGGWRLHGPVSVDAVRRALARR